MQTKYLLGAAIVVAFHGVSANAQLLGGHATGAVNGALSGQIGGARDVGVIGRGNGYGSFGTDLDMRSLRHSTRDVTSSVTDRTRSTIGAVRNRTEHTVATSHEQTSKTSAAVANSADAVQLPQVEMPKSESSPMPAAALDGALSKSVGAEVTDGNERLPLAASADGSATGDASASKRGVSANGSAQGATSASVKH